MNYTRQFLVELRNSWTVAGGLTAVLVGFFALQRPDQTVTQVLTAGGPEWVVTVYAVAVPAFGATFVVFMLSAYATVEDAAENVYDRLLVYPISFPRLLLVRALPVAACGAGAALILGVVAQHLLPALNPVTALAAIVVVVVATVPIAVLVTLLYLWIDDPRVGTIVVFGAIFAGVSVLRYGLSGVSIQLPTLAFVGVVGLLALYGLATVTLVRLDPERIVLR